MNLDLAIPVLVVGFALFGGLPWRPSARWRQGKSPTPRDDREFESDDPGLERMSQAGEPDDSGACVNPATGLAMTSGGCGGYDVGGHSYGDDGNASEIERLDVFDSIDLNGFDGSDSLGMFD